ncbi:Histidine kinase-, DNA gyrase B-, and HSP90-like ATPase [Serratia fonticola]|uniref:ATP-binding protein n=1 Tax=Serratia fonticola TaxID=47917 RepID=UPI002179DD59|nr:ATP-binding protein [Serratia fonticola]CAI1953206.1 Histidine kinase-, DNA gyrase B-, and HSP90-like ATPase [Serratia fonticola]
MANQMNNNKINANPTKEFFIEMLTRDIALDRAILDLIDNSVDSSRSMNKPKSWIKLTMDKNKFEIYDNCGGMDRHVAQNYAFRFGRPSDSPETPNSVGQFGVGMKRTLFKLGCQFVVESRKNDDCFRVKIDVNEWKSKEERNWTFDIEDVTDSELDNGETKITVTSLYREISDFFEQDTFINSLSKEISSAHFKSISKGLDIYINGVKASSYDISFVNSNEIKPFSEIFEIDNVTIKIVAGIAERDIKKGGWYIVCNGRLVDSAEQSSTSGWGTDKIPQYHADYAFFRGVVEFECENSSRLPWTTTKTGVDRSNPIFTAALLQMKIAMRPIIAFLRNRVKEDSQEKNSLLDTTPLNDAIRSAINENKLITLHKINTTTEFIAPEPSEPLSEPRETSIQYKVLTEEINIVKESLGVVSNTDVGRGTFNYYMEYECKNG